MAGILITIIIFILIILVLSFGPRVKISLTLKEYKIPDNINRLDEYLQNEEKNIPELIENTEKIIRWYNNEKKVRELAIIYIHGFSSSRQDIVPTIDIVADNIAANIYYCRLKGHGIKNPDALGEPDVNDWINDVYEGYEIARRIGKKIIIVALSTGVPLALWLQQKFNDTSCIIMLSPNFRPANIFSDLFLLPYGNLLARIFIGKYKVCSIMNELHGRYWTKKFRSEAFVTMRGVCTLTKKIKFEKIQKPVLCIYTEKDKLISIPIMRKIFNRIGTDRKRLFNVNSPYHVISGNIVSPESTMAVANEIITFIKAYE